MESGRELEQGAESSARLNTVVVGIGNQKGGVGKTTVTVQLARALVEQGRRVLIIDLDVNAGATKHLGIEPTAFMGTFQVLVDDEDPLAVAVTNDDDEVTLPEGLHVIAGGRKLEDLETRLRSKISKFSTPNTLLQPVLDKVRGHYDYVLLDTPPSAPLPSILAYTAADYFLLVAIPEGLAIEGLGEAIRDVQDAREFGAHVELLGVVVGAVDRRTRLSRELIAYVEREFEDAHLKPIIQRSTVIPTAQTNHTTIFDAEPEHPVTQNFRELAHSFETRIAALTGVPRLPLEKLALPTPKPLPTIEGVSEDVDASEQGVANG